MKDPIIDPKLLRVNLAADSLQCDYDEKQSLFEAQPVAIQRFIEAQASLISDILIGQQSQIRFSFPDKVQISNSGNPSMDLKAIPAEYRDQSVGGVLDKWVGADLRTNLRIRFTELEDTSNPAVSIAAGLTRHMVAYHLVHNILPAGRSIEYAVLEGEEIPTEPIENGKLQASAITQESYEIAEDGPRESDRGDLQSPFVPAALKYYIPRWVAFDTTGKLIVHTTAEAESQIASMQKYLSVLHIAVGMSPCFVVDPVYIQKRKGILGQLINQGRKLANHQVQETIIEIKRRANSNSLNRGLSLSLPYFDDQDLTIHLHRFEVIPAGRIMFVPAFVVRASREEHAKVIQDTRISRSTRKYLLEELKMLEAAFLPT
jgi:hypothetical protein